MDKFWTGGAAAYSAGIREYNDATLCNLRTRLTECSAEAQRVKCQSEIAQFEAEYKSKLDEIGKLLF